jgi:hypothetical protein
LPTLLQARPQPSAALPRSVFGSSPLPDFDPLLTPLPVPPPPSRQLRRPARSDAASWRRATTQPSAIPLPATFPPPPPPRRPLPLSPSHSDSQPPSPPSLPHTLHLPPAPATPIAHSRKRPLASESTAHVRSSRARRPVSQWWTAPSLTDLHSVSHTSLPTVSPPLPPTALADPAINTSHGNARRHARSVAAGARAAAWGGPR